MQAHLDERAALAEDIKQLCYAFLDVSCNRSAMESLFYKVYCAFGIDLFSEIIEIGSELDEECYCLERMFKMLLEGNERIEALEMGGAPDTEIQKVLRFYSIEQQEAREMEVNKPILEWLQEKRIKVHKSLEVYKVCMCIYVLLDYS